MVKSFEQSVARLPEVLSVITIAGSDDFLVHVARADAHALREFLLDHITSQPDVANAQTSLIFERTAGSGIPG